MDLRGNATVNMTDADDEIEFDLFPILQKYKSGRINRLVETEVCPPSNPDATTGVISKDVAITSDSSVSARLYLPKTLPHPGSPKLPVLVYYHGGAFCVGSSASPTYHRYLNSLVSHSNILVVSVDYRLAPESPLPAAYHDSWTVLQWVISSTKSDPWIKEYGDLSRLFLSGDSAGANICHWLGMKAGEEDHRTVVNIEGIVLVNSFFWGKEPVGEESTDPQFRAKIEKSWVFVYPECKDGADHPWINPTAEDAPDLKGLACKRVLVCVAEKDIFKDRGLRYAEKLQESGWTGNVDVLVSEGEDHVFHLFRPTCDKAVELMGRVVEFFSPSLVPVKEVEGI